MFEPPPFAEISYKSIPIDINSGSNFKSRLEKWWDRSPLLHNLQNEANWWKFVSNPLPSSVELLRLQQRRWFDDSNAKQMIITAPSLALSTPKTVQCTAIQKNESMVPLESQSRGECNSTRANALEPGMQFNQQTVGLRPPPPAGIDKASFP